MVFFQLVIVGSDLIQDFSNVLNISLWRFHSIDRCLGCFYKLLFFFKIFRLPVLTRTILVSGVVASVSTATTVTVSLTLVITSASVIVSVSVIVIVVFVVLLSFFIWRGTILERFCLRFSS